MRHLLYTLIFAFVNTAAVAAERIDGLGPFRMGMGFQDFMALPGIKNRSPVDPAAAPSGLREILVLDAASTTRLAHESRIYSSELKRVQLEYDFGSPLHEGRLPYVTLEFYKDRLATIHAGLISQAIEAQWLAAHGAPDRKGDTGDCRNARDMWKVWSQGPVKATLLKISSLSNPCGRDGGVVVRMQHEWEDLNAINRQAFLESARN